MAGHSATVHGDIMVVFGGLHKQRNSIGHFSSSNDVWCFNFETSCWFQPDIPEPHPVARYGQSQLKVGPNHVLVLGGCGGPNNIFNDVWLLEMDPHKPTWNWSQCKVFNEKNGAAHMWCHPAVKVGDCAIILGKNRIPTPATPQNGASNGVSESVEPTNPKSTLMNMIPVSRHGLNRGYGAIRRPNRQNEAQAAAAAKVATAFQTGARPKDPQLVRQRQMSSSSDSDMDVTAAAASADVISPPPRSGMTPQSSTDSGDISVEPVNGQPSFKTSVTLDIQEKENDLQPVAGPSGISRQSSLSTAATASPPAANFPRRSSLPRLPERQAARLHAFATSTPTTYSIAATSGLNATGAIPKSHLSTTKSAETRQKQLDALKRMEAKLNRLGHNEEGGKNNNNNNNNKGSSQPHNKSKCTCHRLSTHVLDLSQVIARHEVSWLAVKSNASLQAPEETILYSLLAARGELVLFGGIQKDVSSMSSRAQPAMSSDSVSNSVFFLSPHVNVV